MLNPAIALLAWPLVAAWLFARLPFERAIIWSVLGSYLILPSNFAIDLPGLPPMSKESLPNLVLLLFVMAKAPDGFRLLPPGRIAKALLVLLVVGTVATVLTNPDTIWVGTRVLPGLTLYDALSATVRQILVIVPLLIGAQYLASPEAHREILKAFVIAGLGYSVLMLFEVRMSPQLHTWVYGYFPHSFGQQVRWGGYRPVVFLSHGLVVAFFAMTVTLAAAALWRDARGTTGGISFARSEASKPYLWATGYLGAVLVLCKSLGSLLYGIVFVPLILLLKVRNQIRIAVALTLITLIYPILRGADLVPTDTLLEWAASVDPEREQSLRVRFDNEEILLAHGEERPIFGWGGWGRNRIYHSVTGEDISITDGHWIIIIGSSGWAGYIAVFGLLGLPVLALYRKMRRAGDKSLLPVTGALAAIVGINMIELLPNSTLLPWTWLIAGALLGYASQRDEVPGAPLIPNRPTEHPRTVL